jgi:hypothetical protein
MLDSEMLLSTAMPEGLIHLRIQLQRLPFPQMYHLQLLDLVQAELSLKLQVPPLPRRKAQALHLEMLNPLYLEPKLTSVLLTKPFQATSPLVRSSIDFAQQELLLEKP